MDIGAVAASATAIAAVLALVVALYANRSARAARLIDLRSGWEAIHDAWTWTILLRRGPDDYYADAKGEMRERLRQTIATFDELDLKSQINLMRGFTQDVRSVARYLSAGADAVLEGQVSVRELYGVFGPEVARHRAVCYWLAGFPDNKPSLDFLSELDGRDDWEHGLGQIPETIFHDQAGRITLLYELLWAEMARRGDMYSHRLIERASWLSTDSERRSIRKRLALCGRSPMALLRRVRFARQLSYARRLRLTAIAMDPDPILPADFGKFIRRGPLGARRVSRRCERLRSEHPGLREPA